MHPDKLIQAQEKAIKKLDESVGWGHSGEKLEGLAAAVIVLAYAREQAGV